MTTAKNSKYIASVLVLCGVFLSPQGAAAASKMTVNPKPISTAEVVRMYQDKTWTWATGGGRFLSENRKFVAVTEENGKQSLGEGKWTVDDRGTLCMRATWSSGKSAAKANTCFQHGKIGNVIYQRRQNGGKWYVFRNDPLKPTDEFAKLVPLDNVTTKATALKQMQMSKK
jgi:hypothetical protein